MFLLTFLVVHRTSGNVILINYLLCLRHIAVIGNMVKNVIKSFTFQGCFSGGVFKWILSRFFIDFGLILEGLGIPKVAKQLCKVTFSAMVF